MIRSSNFGLSIDILWMTLQNSTPRSIEVVITERMEKSRMLTPKTPLFNHSPGTSPGEIKLQRGATRGLCGLLRSSVKKELPVFISSSRRLTSSAWCIKNTSSCIKFSHKMIILVLVWRRGGVGHKLFQTDVRPLRHCWKKPAISGVGFFRLDWDETGHRL